MDFIDVRVRYLSICDDLGWSVLVNYRDGTVELSQYSPADEDFTFTVNADGFVDNVKAFAASFNPDEHVKKWVNALCMHDPNYSPSAELVEGAKAVDKMLKELAGALSTAQLEIEGA